MLMIKVIKKYPSIIYITRYKLCSYTPKKKKFPYIKTLTALGLISTSGVLIYSYYEPETRKQIENTIPFTQTIFDYILGSSDKDKKKQGVIKQVGDLNDQISKKITSAINYVGKKKDIVENKIDETFKQTMEVLPFKPQTSKHIDHNDKQEQLQEKKNEPILEDLRQLKPIYNVDADIYKALEQAMINIDEKIHLANNIIKEYINHVKHQIDTLKNLMENTDEIEEEKLKWKELGKMQDKKSDISKLKEKAINSVKAEILQFQNIFKENKNSTKDDAKLNKYQLILDETIKNFEDYQNEAREIESNARIFLNYKTLLDDAKEQFRKELQSLYPKFEIGKWTLYGTDYTKDDLNTLLIHAHKKINLFQKELAKQKAESLEQLTTSLIEQQQKLRKEFGQELHVMIEKEQTKWNNDNRREIFRIQTDFENKLRTNLSKQSSSHRDEVAKLLNQQREELLKINEIRVEDLMNKEEEKNRSLRMEYLAKMTGIEGAIDRTFQARTDFLNISKLWVVCASLMQLLEGYQEKTNLDESFENNDVFTERIPFQFISDHLRHNLPNILPSLKADHKNEDLNSDTMLLNTIAVSFSKFEGMEPNNDVYTLKCLTERFSNVKRVCRRVAMIKDPNSSLLRYFFSYLQSFLVVTPSIRDRKGNIFRLEDTSSQHSGHFDLSHANLNVVIENTEDVPAHEGKKTSFKGDTFEIIALAEYYVTEKRDLMSAVRLLNLLEGQPRIFADGWIRDTIKYLEIKQNLKLIADMALYFNIRDVTIDQRVLTTHELRKHKL